MQLCCSCACNSRYNTDATTYFKKNFVKYSLHGSRFVKHIFFNNLVQTDLKSNLSFMRYRIFLFQIKKRFPACMLPSWWVNLWCGITWLVASIYFLHARTWSLLMRGPAVVRYAWSLVRAGTSLARRSRSRSRSGAFAAHNAPRCILASSYIYIYLTF